MKFVVKHEIKGRIRVHFCQKRMTFEEADTLQYYLDSQEIITSSKVQERTQDATICYTGEKSAVIALLRSFHYEKVDVPDVYRQNSGRETNREYWDKLVTKVCSLWQQIVFADANPNSDHRCKVCEVYLSGYSYTASA